MSAPAEERRDAADPGQQAVGALRLLAAQLEAQRQAGLAGYARHLGECVAGLLVAAVERGVRR